MVPADGNLDENAPAPIQRSAVLEQAISTLKSRKNTDGTDDEGATLLGTILEFFADAGASGACDWEIEAALGIERATARPRANELMVKKGWLEKTGEKRRNPDDARSKGSSVYRIVADGPRPVEAPKKQEAFRKLPKQERQILQAAYDLMVASPKARKTYLTAVSNLAKENRQKRVIQDLDESIERKEAREDIERRTTELLLAMDNNRNERLRNLNLKLARVRLKLIEISREIPDLLPLPAPDERDALEVCNYIQAALDKTVSAITPDDPTRFTDFIDTDVVANETIMRVIESPIEAREADGLIVVDVPSGDEQEGA